MRIDIGIKSFKAYKTITGILIKYDDDMFTSISLHNFNTQLLECIHMNMDNIFHFLFTLYDPIYHAHIISKPFTFLTVWITIFNAHLLSRRWPALFITWNCTKPSIYSTANCLIKLRSDYKLTKAAHKLPPRACYGVFTVGIWKKNDCVIMGSSCIEITVL